MKPFIEDISALRREFSSEFETLDSCGQTAAIISMASEKYISSTYSKNAMLLGIVSKIDGSRKVTYGS